ERRRSSRSRCWHAARLPASMQGTKTLRGIYAVMVVGAAASVAYFQARGANELVEASLMVPPRQRSPQAPLQAQPPTSPSPADVLPVSEAESQRDPVPEIPWADAPACDGFELSIVSQAADARSSAATVRRSGDSTGRLLYRGSQYDGLQLLRVGYDARGVTPAVWFHRDYQLCQLRMFSRPKAVRDTSQERAVLETEQVQHSEIRSVGPGSFQVERALVDRLMTDPAARDDAYAAFERGAGGTFALKLRRVRPGGWAHALGLRVGDRVTSVNGHELIDPRSAIEAYAALRMTTDLVLKLERAGSVETVQVAIR
ncbi:MAG TPA: PDZ domain-containing protein, partial [Polyangiaceae bacterium]|nr:PDZ domain-containing protein [Polyangiaceae bacterium]